jgi:hypothetical protein
VGRRTLLAATSTTTSTRSGHELKSRQLGAALLGEFTSRRQAIAAVEQALVASADDRQKNPPPVRAGFYRVLG